MPLDSFLFIIGTFYPHSFLRLFFPLSLIEFLFSLVVSKCRSSSDSHACIHFYIWSVGKDFIIFACIHLSVIFSFPTLWFFFSPKSHFVFSGFVFSVEVCLFPIAHCPGDTLNLFPYFIHSPAFSLTSSIVFY